MSTNKPAFFFSATQSVDDRLGDMFSFIWSSYAGLRELWWQVRGFKQEFPHLHIKDIEKKFLSGLPLPGGIDLKHMCLDSEWTKHEAEFSKWIVFEGCTLYEGWVEKVCSDVFSVDVDKQVKRLQFPEHLNNNGNRDGYIIAINKANENTSTLMLNEFFPTLKASKCNCWGDIDKYLTFYRFFKEVRNAFIHSEGLVSKKILDLHVEVVKIQNNNPSLFKHKFKLPTPILNSKIALDIQDCILFTRIIKKIICTFDAALSVSSSGELLLQKRLENLISNNSKWTNLPSDKTKLIQRVHRMLSASRIPEPVNLSNVMTWMKYKGLI